MGRARGLDIGGWNPEQVAALPTTDRLVRDFLLVTEQLPREQVARLGGVSEHTVRKWERGGFRNLPRRTRERLHGYLVENGFEPDPTP